MSSLNGVLLAEAPLSAVAPSSAKTTPSSYENTIKDGRQVLSLEALALTQLSASLGQSFYQVVEFISNLKGRLIVSGMGKSGHIATKIAATLASTGTPSFFLHPSEASHGDLGMVMPEDAVLCLSNSGETAELSDIILYTRRHNIGLIAMVSKADSFLGRSADYTLTIPMLPEACPHNLAPTTSTTAMLALGDALAITLLKRNSFTAEHFRKFHPGGKLGARLLTVKDLMHTGDDLPLVSENTPMDKVLVHMTSKSFGCTGVLNSDNKLVGVITDGDLRRHMSHDFLTKSACDVMTRNPIVLTETELAAKALAIMQSKRITSLFVVPVSPDKDNKQVLGLLHIHDCLRAGLG